jgi:di- and tripeptidase
MPEYAEDCRQGASWLRTLFKRYGATTDMLNTVGNHNPVILARFKGSSSVGKRLLFYGHYDVIPAANETSRWHSDPFSMEGRDGFLYGRGVTDNKGPILAALYAVADLVAEKKLETDVVFLIEGEEESGSRGFEATVRHNKEKIGHIDWILLANSYWLNDDIPCLTYGLRGVIHANIAVEGGTEDLHSGVNGSSLMDEPLKDLVTLMAKLNGANGRIDIPGFYEKLTPATKAEDERYKAISEIISQNKTKHEDAEALKARWREPSLTIHSFKTSGAGNPTIIPHMASASLSIRLVPDQSAAEIQQSLTDYLDAQFKALNTSNNLTITAGNPADPWLGDPENELYQALEEAIVDVWQLDPSSALVEESRPPTPKSATFPKSFTLVSPSKPVSSSSKQNRNRRSTSSKAQGLPFEAPSGAPQKPLYIREGGSIPIIRFLEREFNAPAAQLPCGQASDGAHLDNERMRLLNLYNSRKVFKKVFAELPAR